MTKIASPSVTAGPVNISAQLPAPRPGRVLDFSNGPEPPRGGRDPLAPLVMLPIDVIGQLLVAHTWSLSDATAPIWVDPGATISPGQYSDLRCEGCICQAALARDTPQPIIVLEHQAGCPEMAAITARAGAA